MYANSYLHANLQIYAFVDNLLKINSAKLSMIQVFTLSWTKDFFEFAKSTKTITEREFYSAPKMLQQIKYKVCHFTVQ